MFKIRLFLILQIIYLPSLVGCPTCIGRMELQSPTFFSDELYELKAEDDIQETSNQSNDASRISSGQDDEGDD